MIKNAYEGIKKLYLASILALASTAAIVITALLVSKSRSSDGSSAGILALFLLISLFGMIAAGIIEIIGLSKARYYDDNFDKAFNLTIACVIVSFFSAFIRSGGVGAILSLTGNLLGLLAAWFVIKGIIVLAHELTCDRVADKGNLYLKLIIFFQAASSLVTFFGDLSKLPDAVTIIFLVLSVVGSVLYLLLLGEAKKMLER